MEYSEVFSHADKIYIYGCKKSPLYTNPPPHILHLHCFFLRSYFSGVIKNGILLTIF